jgi:RNA polymerase sigma-70 factor, ECF subfamily
VPQWEKPPGIPVDELSFLTGPHENGIVVRAGFSAPWLRGSSNVPAMQVIATSVIPTTFHGFVENLGKDYGGSAHKVMGGLIMAATPEDNETDALMEQASHGDPSARQQLLALHRERLRLMIGLRMDGRLAARVDPSDIVQEALGDAARHLDDFLRDRPLPLYLWLRRLAWERLIHAQRQHIQARRRSVDREEPRSPGPADASTLSLADRMVSSGTSPSVRLVRDEERQRLFAALESLGENDREVLVLRYLEGLSNAEIASVLGISTGAVMTRHTRALARLRSVFVRDGSEDES